MNLEREAISNSAWDDLNARNRNWSKIDNDFLNNSKLMVAAGRAMISSSPNELAELVVSFGKTFPSPPCVTITSQSRVFGTQITRSGIANVTTTGFTLLHERTNTVNSIYHWIAVWTDDMDY